MNPADAASLESLLDSICGVVPPTFPRDSWYLIVAATLASVGRGSAFGGLYRYLIGTPGISTDAARQKAVSQRLRETIIKSWTLIGMPRCIAASYALQAADRDGDSSVEHFRADLLPQPELVQQSAQDWFKRVFAADEGKIFAGFAAHKEMDWALRFVVYGLFLADLRVMSPIENEFIVLACVMSTGGVKSPTLSHLKGLRRVGASAADAEAFQRICVMVAQWAGQDTSTWPRASEIEPFDPNTQ